VSPVRRGASLPIYNRIGVLRAERRLSRADLAKLIAVNPQTVGALERRGRGGGRGALMVLTVLMIGGCSPAMILAWVRPDPDPEDAALP
jgi:hypothetical protein